MIAERKIDENRRDEKSCRVCFISIDKYPEKGEAFFALRYPALKLKKVSVPLSLSLSLFLHSKRINGISLISRIFWSMRNAEILEYFQSVFAIYIRVYQPF